MKSARSAAPRRRRPPAPASTGCASRSAAAATSRPGTSPRSAGIAAEQFDFVFHTGDYIYEGRDDGGRNPALVRQHQGDEIYTLVDYRNRYAQYKMDPDLRAAHASAPFIVTWDDHEVDNDYAGDRDENDTPPEVFLLRRAAAYQAYLRDRCRCGRRRCRAARTCSCIAGCSSATLLDLSVLDTRQFRSKQACGTTSATGCAAALDPSRTILGSTQERGCSSSSARRRRRGPCSASRCRRLPATTSARRRTARYSMDKWDGYVASRQRLYARLKETKAPNPIVLSGDVHVHYGADLKMDFANPKSETVGVEFTNTSVTSGGDGADVSATWEQMRGDNPHIKYHSARRGYVACTATPDDDARRLQGAGPGDRSRRA